MYGDDENSAKNSKGDEDMTTAEKVKKPVERLKNSFNEYYSAKKANKKMMSYSEMMKRLKEDDE